MFLEELGKEYRKYHYLHIKTIEVNEKLSTLINSMRKNKETLQPIFSPCERMDGSIDEHHLRKL